jgi:hypothetical protein
MGVLSTESRLHARKKRSFFNSVTNAPSPDPKGLGKKSLQLKNG